MRKIWRKGLAVVLVGALAANVACKDYDDDIDRIDNRIEELAGTVALKTDVQQLQQTVARLDAIDFSAFLKSADFENRLQQAGVAYRSDLKAWLTGDEVRALVEGYGFQTADQVRALVEGLQNADDVAAAFDAMIAAYDFWGALQSDVTGAIDAALASAGFMTGESALSQGQVDQLMAEIARAFGAEGADVKTAIDGWLGSGFAAYMAAYEPTEAFIAKLGIGDAAIAAVKGELTDANSALVTELKRVIADATNGCVSAETLKPTFEAYDKQIDALSARIFELEGRIQSLVWVPATEDEITGNRIILAPRVMLDLTKDGDTESIVLNESTKTLTWKVTPAVACKKIAPEHVSLDVRSVTRAADELLRIADVRIDPAEGTIAVTVSTDADIASMPTLPTIALHLVVPGAPQEGDEAASYQGIDFLSGYTLVTAAAGQKLAADDFRFVKGDRNIAFGQVLTTELDYTDKSVQNFLAETCVAVAMDGEQTPSPVEQRWASIFGEEGALRVVCTPELDADKKPVKAQVSDPALAAFLTLGVDDFAIKTSDKSLQGASVESGSYTYSICGAKGSAWEGYALELGAVRMRYELVTTTVPMQVPDMTFAWSYAAYKENKLYKSDEVAVTGLTVAQYNEAREANFDLALYDGEKRLGAAVALTLTTTPTAESDAKWASLEIRDAGDDFVEGGSFVVKGSCLLEGCRVKVEIPVTVTPMPVLKGIELPASVYAFDGSYDYELLAADAKEGYAARLWAANEAAVKGQITKEEFAEIIAEASITPERNGGKALLSLNEGAVQVTFDAAALDEAKSYAPSLDFAHACGLECSIAAQGVQLTKPSVTWVPNNLYIVNGRAAMKTELVGNLFRIEQKDMSIAYATKEGYDLTYSIYDAAKSAQAEALAALTKEGKTLPAIDADGILTWNDWSSLELIVRVEASKNGVALGETTFVACIADPVGAPALDAKAKNEVRAGGSLHVASLVTLPAGDRDCFEAEGLNADLKQALKAEVAYEQVGDWNPAVTLSKEGVVSVAESSIGIAADTEVKVKVTYTYQFGKKETVAAVVVKKD